MVVSAIYMRGGGVGHDHFVDFYFSNDVHPAPWTLSLIFCMCPRFVTSPRRPCAVHASYLPETLPTANIFVRHAS